MAWRLLLSAWLVTLAGCGTLLDRNEDLRPFLPEDQRAWSCAASIDSALKIILTDKANRALTEVEFVLDSPLVFGAMAGGTTFWSKIYGLVAFRGTGRYVYFSSFALGLKYHGVRSIMHEMLHHLDDIGRDGGEEFINLEEFRKGYLSCWGDQHYHGITHYVEINANDWKTNLFGLGEYSEHIAYAGSLLVSQDCPPKLAWAFRKVFRKYEGMKSPYE